MNFDDVIERYILDPTKYEEGAQAVLAVTRELGHMMDETKAKVWEMADTMDRRLFRFKDLFAPALAAASVAGLVEVGKSAIETADKFDELERKIAAMTGSFQRAKDVMKFGEQEAGITGLFKPEQYDQAALELEAFGLKTERWLPTIERLSAVFGGGADAMGTYAEALGRVAEGDPGRAMMILERAGISREALKQHGVAFKGEREVTSTPEVTMNAIEAVANEKFGAVATEMMNSPEARANKFKAAWEDAMRGLGDGIETGVLPIVDELAKGLRKASDSGDFEKIAKSVIGLFGVDTANLTGAVNEIAGWLDKLPSKIDAFGTRMREIWNEVKGPVKAFFGFVSSHIETIGELWLAVWAGPKILGAFRGTINTLNQIARLTEAANGVSAVGQLGSGGTVTGALGLTEAAAGLGVLLASAVALGAGLLLLKKVADDVGAEFNKIRDSKTGPLGSDDADAERKAILADPGGAQKAWQYYAAHRGDRTLPDDAAKYEEGQRVAGQLGEWPGSGPKDITPAIAKFRTQYADALQKLQPASGGSGGFWSNPFSAGQPDKGFLGNAVAGLGQSSDPMDAQLSKIADNTWDIAKYSRQTLDLHAATFGGDELAKRGIVPLEMFRHNSGLDHGQLSAMGQQFASVVGSELSQAIEKAITPIVQKVMRSALNGAVVGSGGR